MKIDPTALSLIKSPAFCSLEEAIEYAREYNRDSAWELVLSRPDITIDTALEYAYKIQKPNLWKHILVHPRLGPANAILIARELGGEEVWKRVFRRDDVSFGLALSIARDMKESGFYTSIIEAIFGKSDIFPERAIELAIEIDDYLVWSAILYNLEAMSYLNSLPISELFSLAVVANNDVRVYKLIISREDATTDDLYDCLTLTKDNALFEKVLARNDFRKSLSELTINSLVQKAKAIDWYLYWDIVLEREEVKTNAELALSLLEIENHHLSEGLLKLPLLLEYIDNLQSEEAVKLLSINNTSLRERIISRSGVIAHLVLCKKSEAILIVLSCPHHYVRNLIIERGDFTVRESIKYAKDVHDYTKVYDLPAFAGYFRKLLIEDAILLAKKMDLDDVYELLMKRRALSFNKMMELAKEVNKAGVWNIVLARNDVKKYYGIN